MDNGSPKIIIRDHTGARHALPTYDAVHALSEAIRTVDHARAGRTKQGGEGERQILSSAMHGRGKERS